MEQTKDNLKFTPPPPQNQYLDNWGLILVLGYIYIYIYRHFVIGI